MPTGFFLVGVITLALAGSLRAPVARCETAQRIEMVQTRRRTRQRGPALLRLPTDVLRKIATHTTVAPALVVAAGSNLEARTALRKGTDEAERSRFGGIGLTVREAEHVLRTRYRNIVDASQLESQEAARRAFSRKNIVCTDEDHPDAPEDIEDWLDDDGQEAFVASRFVRTVLAYGADPSGTSDNRSPRYTWSQHTVPQTRSSSRGFYWPQGPTSTPSAAQLICPARVLLPGA